MVQTCCVPTCKNRARRGNNISFFTFPQKDVIKRNKWLTVLNLTHDDYFRNKDLRICSQHFHPSDYIFGGNVKKLKKAAVPKHILHISNKENINLVNEVDTSNNLHLLNDPLALKLENEQPGEEIIDTSNNLSSMNDLLPLKHENEELGAEIFDTSNNLNLMIDPLVLKHENYELGEEIFDTSSSLNLMNDLLTLKHENKQLSEKMFSLKQDVIEKETKLESLHLQLAAFQKEIDYLKLENKILKKKQQQYEKPAFTLQRFGHNKEKILYYTSF